MNFTRQKRKLGIFVLPLLIVLGCGSNSYAWNDQNSSAQNIVTGVCAVGAAIIGAVGAITLADWCFSETDDQLLSRVDRECCNCDAQYRDMMDYLEKSLGVYSFPVDSAAFFRNSPEIVLYELATRIINKGMQQHSYRSNVIVVKNQLKTSISTLYKRIHALERKNCNYNEQRQLQNLRILLNKVEKLISHVSFFADCLDHHKSYFNLYDMVNVLRNNYAHCFAVIDQGAYAESNLKNGIIGAIGGRYPLRTFVNTINEDISRLRSSINSLYYHYEAAWRYANSMLDQLMWMKNVVVTDSRYAQECYQWELERLQRLQIEALEAQARAERERVNAIREQNRILLARSHDIAEDLCRHGMYGIHDNAEVDVTVVVNL